MKFRTFSNAQRPLRSRFTSAVAMGAAGVLMVAGASLLAVSPASANGSGTLTVTTTANQTSPEVYGTSVMITSTFSSLSAGAATGTVNLNYSTDGTNYYPVPGCANPYTYSGSPVTCTTTTIPIGTVDLDSVYSGDVTYMTETSAALPYVVNPGPNADSVGLSTSPVTSATLGSPVGISVAMTPSGATGSVTFKYSTDGSNYSLVTGCAGGNPATLTSGNVTCTTSALPLGTRDVSASYSGDGYYEASSSAISFIVNPGGGTDTTTLTVTPASPVAVSSTVDMTATVTAISPSGVPTGGKVTFEYSTNGVTYSVVTGCTNPVVISSEVATCVTSALPFGTQDLVALYSGDPVYTANTSAAVAYYVRTSSVTSLGATPASPLTYSSTLTLTSIVTTGATGTVDFETSANDVTFVGISGCTAQPISVTSYVSTCATTALPTGTNYLEAVYSGNTTYAPSTSPTLYYVVNKAAQAAITVTSTAGLVGKALTLVTTGGSGTGAVTFSVTNGTATGCVVTGSTLKATTAGTCLLTATKATDTNYLTALSSATTVTFVKPIPKAIRVIGSPVVGRTTVIGIAGQYFYGQPTIKTNVAGVVIRVLKDNGSLLSVRVTVASGAKSGTRVFSLTFSNGDRTNVKYNLR